MPYKRASVAIVPNAHIFLTLRPLIRGSLVAGLPDPQIGYEELMVGDADVVVQYTSSTTTERGIAFRGPNLIVTADKFAVYADALSCSNPIRTCVGKGNVIVEEGEERIEGNTIDLDLSSRKFVVNRDATVAGTF